MMERELIREFMSEQLKLLQDGGRQNNADEWQRLKSEESSSNVNLSVSLSLSLSLSCCFMFV